MANCHGAQVQCYDTPAAIDFESIVEPYISAELLLGGLGKHPHPVENLESYSAATDPNPKHIHCTRVYYCPSSKQPLLQYKFYMNDPHWRGADGRLNSPGIPVLSGNPNLSKVAHPPTPTLLTCCCGSTKGLGQSWALMPSST